MGGVIRSSGRAALSRKQLIAKHKNERFWLGVGFVRPHVPFVAPKSYYEPFLPYSKLQFPEKVAGDWDDIPRAGINYKTSKNMKMDLRRQRKAIGGYYASVAYMDAQGGKVLDALESAGIEDETIVIFTSDHLSQSARKRTAIDRAMANTNSRMISGTFHRNSLFDD